MMRKVVYALLMSMAWAVPLKASNPQAELNAFFYDNTSVLDETSKDVQLLEREAKVEEAPRMLILNAFNVNQANPEAWQRLFQERLQDKAIDTNQLAVQVAKLVQEKGPFLSLSHFVNGSLGGGSEGILQQALNAAGMNDLQKPYLAPGNVTQAHILKDIEQVLVTRDDTFLIKSYGDVLNPKTGAIEARAWCEAVVQRIPDVYDEKREEFGRRFEVVRVRWGR